MTTQSLHFKITTKTINDLVSLYEDGKLELSPVFQRQSVWRERDRVKLIDSIFRNYPLPAIFFYKRIENGDIVYDVIDGKQRLESIFQFMRKMPKSFKAKVRLPETEDVEYIDWRVILKKERAHLMTGYELSVIEVDGDLSDIIDIFVRINSTGKALTQQEKRKARYYNSPFLREAAHIAGKHESYFLRNGIISSDQINRMKHIELICELMLSFERNDVLNKKTAVDKAISGVGIDGRVLRRVSRTTTTILNRIEQMFPKLRETRLHQQTDFYTLAVLIGKFEHEGMILTDQKRNMLAWDFLRSFCVEVDDVRHRQSQLENIPETFAKSRDYLLTVSQMTDTEPERRKREQILREIIGNIFERKDPQRSYTLEQRRIIWDKSRNKKCCECGHVLEWPNFTIDHIVPHSRGGRSSIENAALMCQSCNSAKGNKMPQTRRRSA
jgi:hypothetical protein